MHAHRQGHTADRPARTNGGHRYSQWLAPEWAGPALRMSLGSFNAFEGPRVADSAQPMGGSDVRRGVSAPLAMTAKVMAGQPLETQMAAKDDAELLRRLLDGEQKAYRELVVKYQGAMRSVAFAIVGQGHVEDVVQEAWLSAVRNLKGFEGRSSLKTWILTITANAAKCRYVQNRREVRLDDLCSQGGIGDRRFSAAEGHWLVAPSAWHEDTPEALLGKEEFRSYLEDTLQGLSQLQSQVLLLRERQGLELEAIAEQLGISLTNVRVLLHRARLKLFSAIEQYQSAGQSPHRC